MKNEIAEKTPKGKKGSKPGKQPIPATKAIELATNAMRTGRIEEAEKICRQVIEAQPNVPDAYNLLGVLLHRQGKVTEAIESIRKAIVLNSTVANYYSNMGEMQRQVGDVAGAVISLRRALVLDPNYVQGLNNLGIAYYDKAEFENAAKQYRKALALQPEYPEAHNNLGNALRALLKLDEAIEEYGKAIALRPAYAEAENNLATVLRDKRDVEGAEKHYRAALDINPDYLEAHNNLAALLIGQERYDEALRHLAEALRLNEKSVKALINTARAQNQLQNYPAAEMAARKALEEQPENAEAHCVLGQVCHETDRYDEAIGSYEKALEINPNYPECHNVYGVALKSVGRFDDAKAAFRKTLELRPKAYGAYSNLADNETFTSDHELFKAMLAEYEAAEDPDTDAYMPLHFALGKAYDDMGEYDKAFHHWSTGGRLKRAKLNYDEAANFAFLESVKETFPEGYFDHRPFAGHPSSLPIFIVGMPRSGSTLTEQILSAHPEVYGAGEVKVFSHSLVALRLSDPSIPKYPEMMAVLKPHHYQRVAETYLNNMARFSETALTVTDKMLTNFFFIGLIHILFPNAKIIHTHRNPMATCLSCYSKLFKEDMPHTYDLGELGRYYRRYEDLMAHWRKVLPKGVMLDVRYEGVVANIEDEARKLVDFCGLEWDDACLAFHKSDRPVKTASVAQVRKPIYKASVERWKRYGKRLDPLRRALEGIE